MYEEGPMLLTFSSDFCTGEVISSPLKAGTKIKGEIGLRFVMPDPPMEAEKVSEWLDWPFTAKWKPTY